MIGDFHIHSHYSIDSINSPNKIVKIAKKYNMDTIAITDHNTIKGALAVKDYAIDKEIDVIIGSEILTDSGDIIGLYLTEDIHSRNYLDVIKEIHSQGGIAVFPHPYRSHTNIEEIAKLVDKIEIYNGRNHPYQNVKANDLAEKFHKQKTVGSDAHLPYEIGKIIGEIDTLGKLTIIKQKDYNLVTMSAIAESIAINKIKKYLRKI